MRRIDVIKRRRNMGPFLVPALAGMSWADLKVLAKEQGISLYRKNREQLENEIQL